LDERVKECLKRVGQRWGLRYIALFGSRAEGRASPRSDYDMAIKTGRDLDLVERGLLLGDLEECVEGEVDMVLIDDWDPIVAWEALSRRVLIYSCGDECTKEFYEDLAKALDEVCDLEPVIELFRRETRNAFARIISARD